jgi:ubiquinone/menaquinone biosynthesis C-methylase UbiE
MERILEPEIMDNAAGAAAYAQADFSESNQWFVDRLVAEFPKPLREVIDLGCGPADVPIRLARATPDSHITAVDGSLEMLKLAEQAVRTAGFDRRIVLQHTRIPSALLPDAAFDAVLSKDMLHHLPDPSVLWREAKRVVKPGGIICVMDLVRPESPEAARAIVESVTPKEHPLLKQDFYNSLCAAFTVGEVRDQLRNARLPLEVELHARHMRIRGRAEA